MSGRQETKLHEAVRSKDVSRVSRLLSQNADVNARNEDGYRLDKLNWILFE